MSYCPLLITSLLYIIYNLKFHNIEICCNGLLVTVFYTQFVGIFILLPVSVSINTLIKNSIKMEQFPLQFLVMLRQFMKLHTL
jgi:hypothetical protein